MLSIGPTTPSERMWQEDTRQANHAFTLGHLKKAEQGYEASLTSATTLFDTFKVSGQNLSSPVILTISCLNFSDFFKKQGDLKKSLHFLQRACTALIQASSQATLPLEARLACVGQLPSIVSLLTDYPDDVFDHQAERDDLITHARVIALRVYQIAGYMPPTSPTSEPVKNYNA
ncbi:hypothetical protein [Acetobacter senegalensis]|uniref:hypothetical protein n=1 Tax=Acetobacter senegalensis TaxID=446692 RepID=UPI00128AFEEA|nr:hypothetical protein [Acetobacter senegalensis]MPQ72646.1 hypothetical protein [Acetobacter senegalensis]